MRLITVAVILLVMVKEIELKAQPEKEQYRFVLHYINLCAELFRVDWYKRFGMWNDFEAYSNKLCNKEYEKQWIQAVKNATNCEPTHLRKKRDLFSSLLTVSATAVTNLIQSKLTSQVVENVDKAKRSFYSGSDMNNIYSNTAGRYVAVCSESAGNHPAGLERSANSCLVSSQNPW